MFRRPSRRQASVEKIVDDRVASPPSSDANGNLRALLDEVDATALAVYAVHDLPSTPGHYRRSPDGAAWEHLGAALSPAEKWAMLEEHPTDQGWRYASLEQIGARSDIAAVRYASGLLSACQGLRLRLDEGMAISAQDVADAIRLGAAWRRLMADTGPGRSHLKFLAPEDE